MFIAVLSYIAGTSMSTFLPSTGYIGQWINPHSFNPKEHLAIIVMAGSASGAAFATDVLATQKLHYNVVPNTIVAISLVVSSQLIGYGFAGILRESLVYPTKMVWPSILPLNSLLQTLHCEEINTEFNFFWILFGITAVWELFPQYVMPILTGVSMFCLAKRDSLLFTNLFGAWTFIFLLRLAVRHHCISFSPPGHARKRLFRNLNICNVVYRPLLRKCMAGAGFSIPLTATLFAIIKFYALLHLQSNCHP